MSRRRRIMEIKTTTIAMELVLSIVGVATIPGGWFVTSTMVVAAATLDDTTTCQ